MSQTILSSEEKYNQLDEYLLKNSIDQILLVCGKSVEGLFVGEYFDKLYERLSIKVTRFNNFKPNPEYESVKSGVEALKQCKANAVVAVGGGSAMDVAKCIKLFARIDMETERINQKVDSNDIKLIAIPTTAGSGSEATKFAVIYKDGEKNSVEHESILPEVVLFDANVLRTLPIYQKKSTMLDALCHSIESCWSINSDKKSVEYAVEAIKLILANKQSYLENEDIGNLNMLKAANLAGQAINITRTTAGHAMCYKITTLYGVAHGHAAALCVESLFRHIIDKVEETIDVRGSDYLKNILRTLAEAMGCDNIESASMEFGRLLAEMEMVRPVPKAGDYAILNSSVNAERLKNTTVPLNADIIERMYYSILGNRE